MRVVFSYVLSLLIILPAGFSEAFESLRTASDPRKPIIKSIVAGKCVSPGETLQVKGEHLMPSAQRAVVLVTGAGGGVTLSTSGWSMQSIIATLPQTKALQPGTQYPLVIVSSKDKQVLSNRNKTVTVCADKSSSSKSLKVKTDKPGGGSSEDLSSRPQRQGPANGGSLIGSAAPQASSPPELMSLQDNTYEPGELVVISKNLGEAKQLATTVKEYGFRIKRRRVLKSLSLVISVVAVPKEMKLDAALQQLQERDKTLLIDANHRYQFASGKKTGQAGNTEYRQIHDSIAWGNVTAECGRGIKLGVIDSLVDTRHPSIRASRIINKSLLPFGIPLSDKQHATAIASLLVGQPGSQVTGLLPSATLYVAGIFRAMDDDRIDTTAELIVNALDWLNGHGVHAINLSIAGPRNLLLDLGIQQLLNKQVMIVASVGNHGLTDVSMYPAAIKGVVGVTAIDTRDRVYNRANQGEFVQLSAPGVDIWAAREGGQQAYVSGTSFASPFVAAALAVMKHRQPKLTAAAAIATLDRQAQDLGKQGKDPVFGWGRLQYTACP